MKPTTSSSATGSFIPDSPSSVRATLRLRWEPRSTAKIAALSVAAIAEPTISAGSRPRPKIHFAARPASAEVTMVPSVASETAVPSTGRISRQPAERPPSKMIRTRAIVPSVRASSASSNSIPPIPSEPASMPSPRKRSRPGTRIRSASRAAAIPAARRTPARRISSASGPVIAALGPLLRCRQPRLELRARPRYRQVLRALLRVAEDQVEQPEQQRRGEHEADLHAPELVADQGQEAPADEEGGAGDPAGRGAAHLALRDTRLVD